MRYLYKITNKLDGKCYIGQTKNFKQRFKAHKYQKSNSLIHRAIVKYGINNFLFEIIDFIDDNLIDDYEIKTIALYNSIAPFGYNLHGGGCKNKIVSAATRAKLSQLHKGRIFSIETREKLSKALKGKPRTAEAKLNNSRAQTGKKLTDLHKQHIRESGTGRKHSEESKRKISESNKGRILARGCLSPNFGTTHSEETKLKMRLAKLGKKASPETKAKMSATRKGLKYAKTFNSKGG